MRGELPSPAVDVIDTRQNVRLAILLEMLEDVSRAVEPEDAVRAYSDRIGKLRPLDALLGISQRNLPEGMYKITRRVLSSEAGVPRHEIRDPWKNWADIQAHSGGFIGDLIARPEPRLIHNLFLRNDPVLGDRLADMGSCLAMPVFDGGRVLNWTLMFRRDARGFTVDELEQNVLTANLFGAMTRNLVSLEQINRLNEQLRQQFEEVARVQRSLLPKSIPEIPGLRIAASYMPSQQAGGDYYDFFELPGGRLGVMIADVSGHGPAAATVMAMLHAIIHAYPGDAGKATPGEIVAFVNRQLTSANMDGTFATAIVARFDPATRELRYACAGHPPARQVLPGAAGPLVRPLDGEATLPLGIVDELHAPEHRITLEPGHNIVLYTDGITEAFNARREIFGVEGLDRVLEQAPPAAGPQAVIDTIHAAVLGHTGRDARDDDQTLMVLSSE